jgi:hypothetical protein
MCNELELGDRDPVQVEHAKTELAKKIYDLQEVDSHSFTWFGFCYLM